MGLPKKKKNTIGKWYLIWLESFEGRVYNDFGMVNLEDMKNLLWTRVKPEDYEEPRKAACLKTLNIGLSGKGPLLCLNLKHMKMICLKEEKQCHIESKT